MTLRKKNLPLINHQAAAEGLKVIPGLWLPVGSYLSRTSAQDMARQVKAARRSAYAPAGSFDARVEYLNGEPTLYACYLGEPIEEAA